MINKPERQQDIIRLVQSLDISPTMHKNAVEKYRALANYLEENGIDAEIYPQGSFALGTVVRPSANDANAKYDLDFICQINEQKNSTSPSELRRKIERALVGSSIYSDRLEYNENCFTIIYADIGDVGFAIDIVPATDEDTETKDRLEQKTQRADLISTAIAIPRCTQEKSYRWITNNPKGFRSWFNEINQPFAAYKRKERRQLMYRANQNVFASVEDIPVELERSSLQRVIQILKRHRDVYYSKINRSDIEDLKPISAIINVIVAEISKSANPQLSVFDLLNHVLHELSIYSKRMTMNDAVFVHVYGDRSLIDRKEGKWHILNPSNPEDNLADRWNSNADIPKFFFKWVSACTQDLISSLSLPDAEFRTKMENAFGSSSIQKVWANKYKSDTYEDPRPITTEAKPYRA